MSDEWLTEKEDRELDETDGLEIREFQTNIEEGEAADPVQALEERMEQRMEALERRIDELKPQDQSSK